MEYSPNAPLTGVLVAGAALVLVGVAGCERAPDSSAPGAGEEPAMAEEATGPAAEHLRRGWECSDNEDYEGAIAAYTKAIELNASIAEAYRGRAIAYSHTCDEDRVIADYTQLIRLKPDDAEAFLRRGIAHENKGNYDNAVADCTKAIELDPDYAEAYYRRAISLGFRNEYDRKIGQLRKAIELDPDGKVGQAARDSLSVMGVE